MVFFTHNTEGLERSSPSRTRRSLLLFLTWSIAVRLVQLEQTRQRGEVLMRIHRKQEAQRQESNMTRPSRRWLTKWHEKQSRRNATSWRRWIPRPTLKPKSTEGDVPTSVRSGLQCAKQDGIFTSDRRGCQLVQSPPLRRCLDLPSDWGAPHAREGFNFWCRVRLFCQASTLQGKGTTACRCGFGETMVGTCRSRKGKKMIPVVFDCEFVNSVSRRSFFEASDTHLRGEVNSSIQKLKPSSF